VAARRPRVVVMRVLIYAAPRTGHRDKQLAVMFGTCALRQPDVFRSSFTEVTDEHRRLPVWHLRVQHHLTGSLSPGHANDGGEIKRLARIKYKSPFGVAAGLASERSIREAAHHGLVVRFDLYEAHLATAQKAFHGDLHLSVLSCFNP
jgi:hypothetical protein